MLLMPAAAKLDMENDMDEKEITALVKNMSLEEKASLCSGQDFWHTKEIKRLAIPSILMTDGPHGLRKVAADKGMAISQEATCFPTASALACSWDLELLAEVGKALGREAQAQGVQLILGPGINIKRSPLCGRNFEYYSEDPLLTAELAGAFIRGIQSQGVGACLKHFAVNNQESDRMRINAVVDERSLHEIYLFAFERVVKEAKPLALMTAYNKVNGEYCTQYKALLHDLLREVWDYRGIVISDWAAVADRVQALSAGMQLQMPPDGGISDKKIIRAVKQGKIKEAELDEMIIRFLHNIFWLYEHKKQKTKVDYQVHHGLARRAAAESMVLLKNEQGILPITTQKYKRILIVGGFARKPRFQGAGSSQINPAVLDVPYDELFKTAGNSFSLQYAQGHPEQDLVDESLIKQACQLAGQADLVVVLAGLPELYESEGYDRLHPDLPASHNRLISELARIHPKVAVVLQNGSAVTMPWLASVKAVLETLLGGQAVGGAIADVLFGLVNPCGKLAETFARRLEDTPAFLHWPGGEGRVLYGEGIFVGYRYYEKKRIEPLYAFGHGLSYTDFTYSDLKLNKDTISEKQTLEIKCKIKNSGLLPGKEVVQLYLGLETPRPHQPVKKLAAFQKIALQPQEQKTITFKLNKRDFSVYSTVESDWAALAGEYRISLGSSSRDIRLSGKIEFLKLKPEVERINEYSTFKEWREHPQGKELITPLIKAIFSILGIEDPASAKDKQKEFVENMIADIPIYKIVQLSLGKISEETIAEIVKKLK
jgi:beta-glucosidase